MQYGPNGRLSKEKTSIGLECLLLCFLIILAPFEFAFTNLFVSGSILKYYVIAANFLIWVPLNKRQRKKHNNISSIILVIWLVYLIVRTYSTGTHGFGRSMDLLQSIGLMVVTFYTFSLLSFNWKELKLILYATVLSGVYPALFLLDNPATYSQYTERFTVYFLNRDIDPNNLAAFLTIPLIVGLYFALGKRWNSGLWLIVDGMIILSIFLTGSRGGILAAVAGVMVLVIADKRHSRITSVLVILCSVYVFLDFILYRFVPLDTIGRATGVFNMAGGLHETEFRWLYWKAGLQMFWSDPVFGIGFGKFVAINVKGIHNTFLWVLVELGILGFLPIVWLFSQLVMQAHRIKAPLVYSVLAGMSVNIMFLDALNKKFFWLGLILCSVIINSYQHFEQDHAVSELQP